MPEAVPVSGCVRNLNVYGHVNKVSHSHKLILLGISSIVCITKMSSNTVAHTCFKYIKQILY